MTEPITEFVERLGMLCEEDGMPRIAGRIIGFLMLQEGACSLDDLAERLQVSKASISTNARLLEDKGIVVRTSSPGDRRDFYEINDRHWETFIRNAQRKVKRLQTLVEETLSRLPPDHEVPLRRLREAALFYQFLMNQLSEDEVKWRELLAASGRDAMRIEPNTSEAR
jgi:DNA-binding transcriptional regulator GbsR (MarR family)